MKRFLSFALILSVFMSACMPAKAEYSDVFADSDYYASCTRLADLGIIAGYEDGTFRPDNTITRAEFTKIIVCMMDKEDDARGSTGLTGFFDVDSASWYTNYIRYAVNRSILSGYADGSFRPNDTINLQEAVTILLRTLGYNEEEIGYFWPNNYLSAAASLELTNDIPLAPTDNLTRDYAAVLVDRALFLKPSSSLSQANTYLATTGYTVLEDALILDNDESSNSVTVLSGNLKQNLASAYLAKTQTPLSAGDMYHYAAIDKNGYLVAVCEYTKGDSIASVSGTINKFSDSSIEYTTTEGLKSTYNADSSFLIYRGSERMTLSQAKSGVSNGTDITFYGDSYGLWSIAVVGNADKLTPVLASKNYAEDDLYLGTVPINHTNLTVYRNGEASSLSEIKAGDVVYYNTKTNVIDVYTKKVTGTYYSAYPSKAYVEKVTVSGKEYEIGNSSATNKLNASAGAFEIGDKITLLLGKNDKIAFVTDNAQGFDYSAYGVILRSETKIATSGENEGNTEFVTTLFMADGEEHEIVTDKLYKDSAGKLVSINYKKGGAQLTVKPSGGIDRYAGDIDKNERTINSRYLLKDAAIIQRTSDENSQTATCELLDFDRLTASKLSGSQILNFVSGNSFGDLAILYVDGLENTNSFGVIAGFEKTEIGNKSTVCGYKIISDGYLASYLLAKVTVSTSTGSGLQVYYPDAISTNVGAGVQFKASLPTNVANSSVESNVILSISPLYKVTSQVGITAVEGGRISLRDKIYTLSDNVQIVDISDTEKMRLITIDDLAKMLSASVTLYSDKADGIIRVITVRK